MPALVALIAGAALASAVLLWGVDRVGPESLEQIEDGRLTGRFEVTAAGQTARLVDERWKAVSLSMDDQLLVGQGELGQYLPGAIVDSYSRGAETSGSSRFQVEGTHSRGPVQNLERLGRAVLPLAWRVPSLPLGYWRILRLDRLFVLDLLMTVRITLRLGGTARSGMEDVSRIGDLDNDIARITETVTDGPEVLEIQRTIELKTKIVRGRHTELLPATLEHIEKTLRMAIACRAETAAN